MQTFLAIVVTALGLSIGLWLDLTNRGLVWDVLWNITGETEPAAQLLGASQYAASFTRIKPDDDTPAESIQNIPENPFGINTFLQLESIPDKRERQMQLLAEAGFGWIRQEFPWEDIEIHARGDFMDRRNVEAVGEISAWDKYDNIVDLAEEYEVNMIVRLSNPPAWSQPELTTTVGPPEDLLDFVNFAVAVAERYEGRIQYYQIWNEPNLYPEWGERQVDPAAYVDMLCRTHDALKKVDPNIVVLTAAIGPSIELSGRNAYDLLYLQRLYDEGMADCYDILSAQAYGLFSGPTDRRARTTLINYARPEWLRDVMVANGDAHKPIWISEAGWNPVPPAEEVPDMIGRETYGEATMSQAADWIPIAYERAMSEWQWVGVINYWFLKRPDESEVNLPWYYFRVIEPDFSPTPLYTSFVDTIQNEDWQAWRDQSGWQRKTREQIPQIIILALTLGFGLFTITWAVVGRLTRA